MVAVVPYQLTAEQIRSIKNEILTLVVETRFIESRRMEKLDPIIDQLLQNAHHLQYGQYDAATNLNEHKSCSSRSSTVRHKLKATLIACLALAFRHHNPHVQNVAWSSCRQFQQYWQLKSRDAFPPFRQGEDSWPSLFEFRNAIAILLLVAKGGKLIVKMAAGILSRFHGVLSSGTPTHKIVRRDAIYKETLLSANLPQQHHIEVKEEKQDENEALIRRTATLPLAPSPEDTSLLSFPFPTEALASMHSPIVPIGTSSSIYGLQNIPKPRTSRRKTSNTISPSQPPLSQSTLASLPVDPPVGISLDEVSSLLGRRQRPPPLSIEDTDSEECIIQSYPTPSHQNTTIPPIFF